MALSQEWQSQMLQNIACMDELETLISKIAQISFQFSEWTIMSANTKAISYW